MNYWTRLCFWLMCGLLSSHLTLAETDTRASELKPLRFGMTPAIARSQYSLLEQWRLYLEQQLHQPVELVIRDNQQDSVLMLKQHQLDFAWISAPAYLSHKQQTRLLVTPLYHGHPYDRAYLIVPATDQRTQSLQDLKGKLFAYMDTDSSSGYLEPRYQLRREKQDPEQFFKASFLTRDHLKVVAAVAIGLADGGSLSGFAWDTLARARPDITTQTRIVSRSAELALPPIVMRRTLDPLTASRMQQALINMSADDEGRKLLLLFNLDGFMPADDKLYRSISLMMQAMERP